MDTQEILKAANLLREGKLVALPTETVYGLGADATNRSALELLYRVKGRPTNHPVIVHLHDEQQLQHWAVEIPNRAWRLAEAFWPGPLTMVLRRNPSVLDQVTGGQDTVALRVPNHPVALALLKEFAGGIAAPSANRFGRLSPTRAQDVKNDLGEDVSLVLNGGDCLVGIESTIVDLSWEEVRVLRPGMILASEIENVLSEPVATHKSETQASKAPRTSGNLPSHYAPKTPVQLVSAGDLQARVASAQGKRVSVLSFSPSQNNGSNAPWVVAPEDAFEYARCLYSNLRILDSQNTDLILVEAAPESEQWSGVRDRLSRAAFSSERSNH